tara:strand:+ start:2195 stop:3763 length:1569 start_codon:yes stop_codon:yes gene_type:complete
MKTKKTQFIIVFVLLCIFIKTDYRLETGIYCCKDDHDYYSHAETLVLDFDFDYSNQLFGNEGERFLYNGKSAPYAFFGTGLLAAPFLFVGDIFDKLIPGSEMFNYKIIFYSFSPIFYLFFTFLIFNRINEFFGRKFSSYFLYLLILGSGVGFYAFERFSMSHVYEVFTISLLIYYCLKFYMYDENNYLISVIPFLMMLAVMTRWVNIYILLVPYLIGKLTHNKTKNLFKNKYFIGSSILSSLIFLLHTYLIYGVITINPEFTYSTSGTIEKFLDTDLSYVLFILSNIKNLFLLLLGPEFGLFWFSPVIFIAVYFSFKNLSNSSKVTRNLHLGFLLCMLQIFGLVLLWRSTGSSYGFRYTMNLVPIALLVIMTQSNINKFEKYYLITMSFFSSTSVLFFEMTLGTQLATEYTQNSFGKITKFTQPDYLVGYLNSFFSLEAYLKIFSQSFLGFFLFFIIIKGFGLDQFFEVLARFSLPYDNPDFQSLMSKIQQIETTQFMVTLIIIVYLSYLLVSKTHIFSEKS